MKKRSSDIFSTVRSEGAMLPPEILARIQELDSQMGGLTPEAFHLDKGEKVNEAINRSWNRLLGVWGTFRKAIEALPQEDPGTTLTREKWLLKLFDELGYGRLQLAKPVDVEGTTYAISHIWKNTPIHLIGFRAELDKTVSRHGGATYQYKPHSMVQTFLNRTEGHLWAFLSNGLKLRILRDNTSLVRQAYIEFDLEAMMEGGIFPDFKLLWLLCHQSRVETDRPEDCWLEKWSRATQELGTRLREDLQEGVRKAIEVLGAGFLAHPANDPLREELRSGRLDKQAYYRELLRFVYQLIFLFVAEDRDLLAPPSTAPEAKDRYTRFYSATRLRFLAGRKAGTRHDDLYRVTRLVIDSLGEGEGRADLGIPVLNSSLFSVSATPSLKKSLITNADYLEAIRALAIVRDKHGRRPTDFRNLGSEELGSVYESLLEMHPDLNIEAKTFALKIAAGNERKTTGSYYTPTSLISCLLDSALDPVLDEAVGKENPEKAILDLKVCDPACGSGHFLIAAAKRMASRLASVRAAGDEPTPDMFHRAIRDVIGRSIYGVDINPMAVELCKVSLWMEALEPGKPLSFLDHHIRAGNSLLGATPELIACGLPDEAFTAIEGDDKKACTALKKRNKSERKGLGPLFALQEAEIQVRLQQAAAVLADLPDDRPDDIHTKEMALRRYEQASEFLYKKQLADAWCAAFVIKKYFREPGREASAIGVTQGHLNDLAAGRSLPADFAADVERLSGQYQFFHWHLAFPEVFGMDGFNCVLSNPPWETIKLQDKEWFASRRPEISEAPNTATRNQLIAMLKEQDPGLYAEYIQDRRVAAGSAHLLNSCGNYPLCGSGDINTFALFAELARGVISASGRVGCVLPTGIVTDDPYKRFFQDVLLKKSLISVFDFENQKPHFPAVKRTTKFCLFTSLGINSSITSQAPQFLFFGYDIPDLQDTERCFALSADTISRVNPNTLTCPVFRSKRDAILTGSIHNRHDVLVRDSGPNGNPWNVNFTTLFHMSGDSELFRFFPQIDGKEKELVGSWLVVDGERWAPLYEQNLFHIYDHRFASYSQMTGAPSTTESQHLSDESHESANVFAVPRYWIREHVLAQRWEQKGLARAWTVAFRQSARTVDSRTGIFCILPRVASGHSVHLAEVRIENVHMSCARLAEWTSFSWDYLFRQSLGGNNTSFFVVKQVAAIAPSVMEDRSPWSEISNLAWCVPRVLELTYTAWDLETFAQDCGWSGPPFRWDEGRRFLLRCELDAAFFHLYLQAEENGHWRPGEGETAEDLARLKASFPTPRDAVAYIMETFPIVRRKDEEKYGTYRTKDTILEIYIAMAEALRTGHPYHTRLDPPPADPRCCHPPREAGQS